MNNWATELRKAIAAIYHLGLLPETVAGQPHLMNLIDIGEQRAEHALNTVEALTEANADLRRQLYEALHFGSQAPRILPKDNK